MKKKVLKKMIGELTEEMYFLRDEMFKLKEQILVQNQIVQALCEFAEAEFAATEAYKMGIEEKQGGVDVQETG